MTNAKLLTNYLPFHRKRLGYTQKHVANLLGCSTDQISRYERGRLPDLNTAFRFELLYQTPVQKLFTRLYQTLVAQQEQSISHRTIGQQGKHRILALDPWTQGIGEAVLERGRLIQSGIRYLRGTPLPERLLVKGKAFVEELLYSYEPRVVVLPKTDHRGSTRSKHVRAFCRIIKKLVTDQKLRFSEWRPDEVNSFLNEGKKFSRHRIAAAVAKRFPQLADRVPPPRKLWEPQNLKTSEFYAVALALAASDTQKNTRKLPHSTNARSISTTSPPTLNA